MSVRPEHIVDISTIDASVRRIISEELGVEMPAIKSGTDIIREFGADQSDMDTIKTAVEHRFYIKISDENWRRMGCVCDIVHLVDVYLEIKQIEM